MVKWGKPYTVTLEKVMYYIRQCKRCNQMHETTTKRTGAICKNCNKKKKNNVE